MNQRISNAMDLSYALDGLPGLAAYREAAAACLRDAVPGDLVGWNGLDLARGTAEVWFDCPEAYGRSQALANVMTEHPLVRRYLSHPESMTPLRVSDCATDLEFRAGRVFHDLFVPMQARYQIAIVTALAPPPLPQGLAWIVNRSGGRDFAEGDIARARTLQPMLALLEHVYRASAEAGDGDRRDEARQRARLTERELDVLALVADGLSALQIAHLRRISDRTVRKHLEHVYRKLDCHDRVLAINKARLMGLL